MVRGRVGCKVDASVAVAEGDATEIAARCASPAVASGHDENFNDALRTAEHFDYSIAAGLLATLEPHQQLPHPTTSSPTSMKQQLLQHYKENSPFILAVKCGDIQLVEQMLVAGADVNSREVEIDYANEEDLDDDEFAGVSWFGLGSKSSQAVKESVSAYGLDSRYKTTLGRAVLHIAVEMGYPEIVSLLLRHGASVNAEDGCGFSALHIAVADRKVEMVKILLNHGANLEGRLRDEFPVAVFDLLPALVEVGTRFNCRQAGELLCKAAFFGRGDSLGIILNDSRFKVTGSGVARSDKALALRYAVELRRWACVRLMLENGFAYEIAQNAKRPDGSVSSSVLGLSCATEELAARPVDQILAELRSLAHMRSPSVLSMKRKRSDFSPSEETEKEEKSVGVGAELRKAYLGSCKILCVAQPSVGQACEILKAVALRDKKVYSLPEDKVKHVLSEYASAPNGTLSLGEVLAAADELGIQL